MNDYEVFLIILYDPENTNQSFCALLKLLYILYHTGMNWISVNY